MLPEAAPVNSSINTLADVTKTALGETANATSSLQSALETLPAPAAGPLISPLTVLSATAISVLDNPQLAPVYVTPPVLGPETLGLWKSLSANVVSDNASVPLKFESQLPAVVAAGALNLTATSAAEDLQSSVLLDASFSLLAGGTDIVKEIDSPGYLLPNTTSVVTVLPTFVTRQVGTSGQFVATPPFNLVPGQAMMIPIADSAIPGFGGLKDLEIQSSPNPVPAGGGSEEWLTAEVDDKIPPSLPSSGIAGSLVLFLDVQYPFDDTGKGFNWGNPANHARPPAITLVVNKTSQLGIQTDAQGCPVLDAYTLSLGSWTSNGLGEISSKSSSPTQCQVKIQSQHLSKFAFSMRHIGEVRSSSPGQFGIGEAVDDRRPIDWQGFLDRADAAPSVLPPTETPAAELPPAPAPPPTVASSPGFSNIECTRGPDYTVMTGLYTGTGGTYEIVFLQMKLLDKEGHVVGTGNGLIQHATAGTPTFFSAIARTDHDFASCTVQVDNLISR